jgi:hypothetical protein
MACIITDAAAVRDHHDRLLNAMHDTIGVQSDAIMAGRSLS